MWGKRLDTNRRSRSWRLGPVAVLLSIVTLLSVVAPYGIAGAGPVGIAGAAEPTSVPADGTIDTSGHYVLDGDFSGPITITADDVVLDGRGHWVNGTDSTGIGVNVTEQANVTVRNLSAYNWGTAIFYDTAVGGEVRDVSLWGAPSPPDFTFGVEVFNSSGVTVRGSLAEQFTTGVRVLESTDIAVLENSGARISALSSTNVTVAHNDAVNNGNHGIILSNTTHSVVENNTATDNSPYGIHLNAGSDDNRIADNNASDNDQAGIVLDSSADNVLVGNDASGNDGSGEQTGIRLDKSSNNVIADTNASNNLYGVHIWNSNDSVVRNVTAVGNTEAGIYVEWTGARNVVTASNASNNGNYGVLLEDWVTDTVVNDTVATGNVHGVFVRDGSNGTTIESNGLSENSNSGITVSGTSENPSAKPSILRNNVTGNSFGINLRYAPDANVANNTVARQDATGIYIRFSENASVTDNTITRNDKGIFLTLASANATIGNNTIINNTINGIEVDSDRTSMNGTVVKGNEIVGNGNPFSTLSGLRLVDIQDVLVYDNLFNNSQNVTLFDAGITWNVTKTAGTNVVGGQFIGGNAWLAPDGLGFSQTCADDDGDGLCDSSLTLASGGVDYLPLAVTGPPAPTSPEIEVSPTSLDFGGVTAGNSTSLDVTIENVGTATLSVTGTTLGGTDTGAFSVSNGGSFTLAPGENRTVSVTYTPPANATHGAVLNVTANDTDEPEMVVSLSGTGLSASGGPPAPAPDVSVSPLSYDYGTVTVGNDSNTTVRIENVGNASLSITDTVVTDTDAGEFSIVAGGGAHVLPAGANLSVTVAFTPSSSGSKSASFTVHTNDTDEPAVAVSLSGTGEAAPADQPPAPEISVTPTSYDFGNVSVGSSATTSVVVENVGTADLNVTLPSTVHQDDLSFFEEESFGIAAGGGTQVRLAPGETHALTVSFEPRADDSYSGSVLLTHDAATPSVTVLFEGNGTTEPEISVSPAAHDFGDVSVGESSTTNVTVSNDGSADLDVTGAAITGTNASEFAIVSGTTTVLAPDESVNLSAEFSPTATGRKVATITVLSNDTAGSPPQVELVGNATEFVDDTPPGVQVTNVAGSNVSASRVWANETITVEVNASDADSSVSAVVVGIDSNDVTFRTDENASFDGSTGTWTASFQPTAVPDDGSYTLTATATDTAGNENQTTAELELIVDRTPPRLHAGASREDATTARVNVTASEPLRGGNLDVTATLANGSQVTPMLTKTDTLRWTGTFHLPPPDEVNGSYVIEAVGTDFAGNTVTAWGNATIEVVRTANNSTSVETASGTNVTIDTSSESEGTVSISETGTSSEDLPDEMIGGAFLDVTLTGGLDANQTGGTIRLPVRPVPGVAETDVVIHLYDESTGEWEPQTPTTIEEVGGVEYWVADVPHFSTYGAMATDTDAPTIDSVTPAPGTTLPSGTSTTTVRFDYGDAGSGVNASAVTVSFDGTPVAAQVTSGYATYDATGLAAGEYTASVTVEDLAGNGVTFDHSFAVAGQSSGNSGGTSVSGGGSPSSTPTTMATTTPTPTSTTTTRDTSTPTAATRSATSPSATPSEEATPGRTAEPTTTTGPGQPGFGPAVALVAILAAGLLGRRRRR